MFKKAIIFFISILIIIFISAALFIKTSSFEKSLKKQLEKSITSFEGESVTIENISFKPYSGYIEFNNIVSKKYGTVKSLKLHFSILKLLTKKFIAEKVELSEGNLHFTYSLSEKNNSKPFDFNNFFKNLKTFLKKNKVKILDFEKVNLIINSTNSNEVINLVNIKGNSNFSKNDNLYIGNFSTENSNFTFNKFKIDFKLTSEFFLSENSFGFKNFNIFSKNSNLNLTSSFQKNKSKIEGKLILNLADFFNHPFLEKALTTLTFKGNLKKVNGILNVQTKFTEINGLMEFDNVNKQILFTDCNCGLKKHDFKFNVNLDLKDNLKGDLKVTAKGDLFKNVLVKGNFHKDKSWKYNFQVNLVDLNNLKSNFSVNNIYNPNLRSINLSLPFLKAKVKNNSGVIHLVTKDFNVKCSGDFFKNNIFQGNAVFNTFNLFGTIYPKFKGNLTVLKNLKVIANSITLFDNEKGFGKGSGWFTKDGMDLSMNLRNLDFKTGLFIDNNIDDLDINGKVDGFVKVTGDYDKITVSGNVILNNALIFQTVFEKVNANFTYFNDFLNIDNIVAKNGEGNLKGKGIVDLKEEKLNFIVEGNGFNIQYIPVDFFKVENGLGFISVTGSLNHPIIKAQFDYENLMLGPKNFKSGNLKLNTKNDVIFIKTSTNSGLDIDTSVDFNGPLNFNVKGENVFVDFEEGYSGIFSANFNGTGDFNNLDLFSGKGVVSNAIITDSNNFKYNISNTDVYLKGMDLFANDINLDYENSNIFLKNTKLNLTSLILSGDIKGKGKAKVIKDYLKNLYDFNLDADYEISGKLTGYLESPKFQGSVSFKNGIASIEDLSFPIKNVNGSCDFDTSILKFNEVNGNYGDGSIKLNGFISETGEVEIKSYLNNIPFDTSGIYASVDGFLLLKNSINDLYKLSGKINVHKGFVEESQLLNSETNGDFPAFFEKINLEIGLEVKNSEFENPYMHLFMEPSVLSLQGTLTDPIILGNLNFANTSTIEVNDIEMKISRGNIIFDNPFNINPFFNIMAETDLQGYNIVCRIKGDANSQMNISFSSNPPLDKNRLFALLFGSGGVSTGSEYYYNDPTTSNETDLTATGLAIALNNLFSPFQKKVKNRLNVERIQITPQVFSEKGDPSPIITVEKDMSSRLTGTYSQTVSGAGENLIQFKYRTSNGNYIISRKEIDNTYTLEFEFIKKD